MRLYDFIKAASFELAIRTSCINSAKRLGDDKKWNGCKKIAVGLTPTARAQVRWRMESNGARSKYTYRLTY
jgi:hypothetical protein